MRMLRSFLTICCVLMFAVTSAKADDTLASNPTAAVTQNTSNPTEPPTAVNPNSTNPTLSTTTIDASLAPALNLSKLQAGQETLNVGHYKQLPPFYFDSPSKSQPGFGYEIFTEVAKKAGIKKINFVGFDNTANLNQQLKEGKIDLIANSWDLPGMRKHFLLTTPYYSKGGLSFLYFKNKGPFKSMADLNQRSIGVLKGGYAAHYWLPAHGINTNSSSVKNYSSINNLLSALREGDIDVALVYYPLAKFAKNKSTDLDVLLVEPINDVYAMRKQDIALQNALNQAINTLSQDGTLEKIVKTYLDPAEVAPPDSGTTSSS